MERRDTILEPAPEVGAQKWNSSGERPAPRRGGAGATNR